MTGTASYEQLNIPEAIKYPRGLSLSGPWSGAHGSHLTFVASEDFRQTAKVVPSPSSPAANDKALLRFEARQRRNAFVASLSQAECDDLEIALCELLEPLVRESAQFAIYSATGSEIGLARLAPHDPAYPAFASREAPMVFRSGHCAEDCPWGGVQPPHQAREVVPDLVFVPLLAVDHRGHRLGQGGGHYDCALPALRAVGTQIIGVGWAMQRIDGDLPDDPWDVPLDGFASPEGLEMFR